MKLHSSPLAKKSYLDEVHHLLWRDPFNNRGAHDFGWFCREHAFFSTIVARSVGLDARTIHGQAYFSSPHEGRVVGFRLSEHSFVEIDYGKSHRLEVYDSSVRFRTPQFADPFTWNIDFLCSGRASIINLIVVRSASEFAENIEKGKVTERNQAVYWPAEFQKSSNEFIENACGWINSVLTDELLADYGEHIYLKAMWHIFNVVSGRTGSLTQMSQSDAWKSVAALPDSVAVEAKNLYLHSF